LTNALIHFLGNLADEQLQLGSGGPMQVMYMAIVYLIRMRGVLSDSARRGSHLSMQERDLILERFRLYTEEEESTQIVVNLESCISRRMCRMPFQIH
jgi:hypothetical protein